MKKISLLGVLAISMLFLTSCEQQPSDKSSTQPIETTQSEAQALPKVIDCQLTMGWDPWEPYQYLTPDDEVKGLEIELVSAMAREAGCSVTFVQKDWMNLLNGIRAGNIDMLGGASKTVNRGKFAYFSDDYRHESFILYLRAGEQEKYSNMSLTQLLEQNFRLGVTQDYIYGEKVSKLQDNEAFAANFVSVPTTEVNYYNLLQHQIDGFLEDPFVAAYTIKRKGLQGQIQAHTIEVHSGDVAIMFSKKSVAPETVEGFNQGLKNLKASGEYQAILAKYSH